MTINMTPRRVSVPCSVPHETGTRSTCCHPNAEVAAAVATASKPVRKITTASAAGRAYRRAAGTQRTLPAASRTKRTCAVTAKGSARSTIATTQVTAGSSSAS